MSQLVLTGCGQSAGNLPHYVTSYQRIGDMSWGLNTNVFERQQIRIGKAMDKAYGLMASVAKVLDKYNARNHNGKKVLGGRARIERKNAIFKMFRDLRDMGYRLKHVNGLGGRHVQALVNKWVSEGKSASHIQKNLSFLRTFASWIGKDGMVLKADHYVSDPALVERSYAATEPKTWAANGIDVETKIQEVMAEERNLGYALMLQAHFALRAEESMKFKPHLADQGDVLFITKGTKGGRDRTIKITTPEQRELMDKLKDMIAKGSSLIPKERTYEQYRSRYYYVLQKCGISRKNGIVGHYLRHGALHKVYQDVTGHDLPINGSDLRSTDKELDSLGRQAVSECAGHARESISSAYIGSKKLGVECK